MKDPPQAENGYFGLFFIPEDLHRCNLIAVMLQVILLFPRPFAIFSKIVIWYLLSQMYYLNQNCMLKWTTLRHILSSYHHGRRFV